MRKDLETRLAETEENLSRQLKEMEDNSNNKI